MNPKINKHLAAFGVALAALFAVVPRSTAAVAPASVPPKSGIQIHWFHSHTGVRSLQSRESRFDSKAVVGLESMRDLASLESTYRFEDVQPVPALHAAVVTVDEAQLHELLASAPTDPRVRYVSPPGPTRRVLNLPSDPLLRSVDPNTHLPYEWQFSTSHIEQALDLTPGDAKIKVGVIDTGVDIVPDLRGKVDGLYDVNLFGTQPSPSSAGNDDYGHGTAVASLIGAAAGDGFGMAGFGGAAHVIGIHAGTHGSFTDADVALALAKLDELGVRIVNLSLGGSAPSSPMLVDAIHKAASDGMLIVAAAGNEASDHVSWPAADLQPSGGGRSYGLAVGATNADGSIASFSNTGRNLSLTAPGNFAGDCSGVLVALPKTNLLGDSCYPQWSGQGGATYGYVAGTSFSSPEVAGVAALVWSARPELRNYQVADIIKQSATGNAAGAWTPSTGCGHVDAAAAVQLALSRSAAEWALISAAGAQPCSVDGSDPAQWPREVDQTITFGTIADRTTADPDFRVHAKASSGLPVEYEAHNNCTVRGNVVHMTGTGLCVITASQSGSADFNPATPVAQAFAISDRITALPLPARGRLGGLVTLRYRFNAIGFVTTSVVVQRNGKTIARFGRPYAEVESGYVHRLAWRTTHAGPRGRLRFCVTARDRLQTRVVPSCAPIELRPAASSSRR